MTYFHIVAGSLAMIFGFAALIFNKGSKNHRRAGNVFFITMLAMASTGAAMAYLNTRSLSVVAGMLTLYLVITAWTTVKTPAGTIKFNDYITLILGIIICVFGIVWGLEGIENGGVKDGFPASMYIVFGSIAGIGALFDLKLIVQKGISGKHRIIRHLWRMTFGLWMAVTSFFLGQQQVFPDSMKGSLILTVPVFAVLLILVFWFFKVLFGKRFQRI